MILLLSDDLLDASKTITNGRAAGVSVVQCKTLAAVMVQMELQEIACCVVDLQLAKLEMHELFDALTQQKNKPRVIAYGSHVDAARLKAARDAGCDEVMPRSKYFEEMPKRIAEWDAEERLESLPLENRIEGASIDELLAALSPQSREALARRLKANGSPPNTK